MNRGYRRHDSIGNEADSRLLHLPRRCVLFHYASLLANLPLVRDRADPHGSALSLLTRTWSSCTNPTRASAGLPSPPSVVDPCIRP